MTTTPITRIPTYAELHEAVARTAALHAQAAEAYRPFMDVRWALVNLRTTLTGDVAAVAQLNVMIACLTEMAAPARTAYHDTAEAVDAAKAEQMAWGA